MKKRTAIAVAALALLVALALTGWPVVGSLARGIVAALAILALLWGAWRLYRASLWKVGRRLAFSYFLIGLVPIPLVALLGGAVVYLLSGFLLGHLYTDAVASIHADLEREAQVRLSVIARGGSLAPDESGRMAFALYRYGRRVTGDPRLPAEWPAWASPADEGDPSASPAAGASPAPAAATSRPELAPRQPAVIPFFAAGGDNPTLAAAAADATAGVLALYSGDLETEISERSDVWINLYLPDQAGAEPPVQIQVGEYELSLHLSTGPERQQESREFFAARAARAGAVGAPAGDGELPLWDRPLLWWNETPGPLLSLAGDG